MGRSSKARSLRPSADLLPLHLTCSAAQDFAAERGRGGPAARQGDYQAADHVHQKRRRELQAPSLCWPLSPPPMHTHTRALRMRHVPRCSFTQGSCLRGGRVLTSCAFSLRQHQPACRPPRPHIHREFVRWMDGTCVEMPDQRPAGETEGEPLVLTFNTEVLRIQQVGAG